MLWGFGKATTRVTYLSGLDKTKLQMYTRCHRVATTPTVALMCLSRPSMLASAMINSGVRKLEKDDRTIAT